MSRTTRVPLILILAGLAVALLVAPAASAQGWRGMGRVAGKVVDQDGKPLPGVLVRATFLSGEGSTEAKTNKDGEWAIGGIAPGQWALDFQLKGYEPRSVSVGIAELTRIPPLEIVLKKAAPVVDPNEEIRDNLVKAAELMNVKRFKEARDVYESLLAKYPEAYQLHPLIARAYYAEDRFDKSIEHLRLALQWDPENVEVKLLLGNVLVEQGDAEEGRRVLASVDETQVKDPTIYVNVGIGMLNQDKVAEAVTYFDTAIAQFPEHPDAYYYRGISRLQLGNVEGAKADLQRFLTLAPEAPEAPTARKILDQLK